MEEEAVACRRITDKGKMFNLKTLAGSIFALTGFGFGAYLDYKETLRMTLFRDKSALYGRELLEGEQPSWPTKLL